MDYKDRVYGEVRTDDQVLRELIRSKPVQRLKYINQAGPSKYLAPMRDVSRFEHSVGVMFLLRKFGATLEEQAAGLLHDIPHTAFSHVVDFVFENEHHEYHEQFHQPIMEQSEIPGILKKYGIPKTIIDTWRYRLLERKLPDLCADRIDYALRDSLVIHKDKESISAKLNGLDIYNGEFVFKNMYAAESFASDYIMMDATVWGSPREAALYTLLAQAIQHALEKKFIKHEDLFSDDDTLYEMLKSRGDAFIHKKLEFLRPSFRIESATRENHHLFVKTKLRAVDPKVKSDKGYKRLSELSKKFKRLYEAHRKKAYKGWYMDVFKK